MARKIRVFKSNGYDKGALKKLARKVEQFLKSKRGGIPTYRIRKVREFATASKEGLVITITYKWGT